MTTTTLTNTIVDQRLLVGNRPIKRVGEYINSYSKIEWQCLICGHVWQAPSKRIFRGAGCPQCDRNDRVVRRQNTDVVVLNDHQHDILTGLMLGDGHLHRVKKSHNAYLTVERSSVDKEFLIENYDEFRSLCLSPPKNYSRIQVVNNVKGTYHYTRFQTRSLPIFSQYHDLWYPNGEKIVPSSLKLTPLIIAIWVADDAYVEPKSSPYRLFLRFCSEGFSELENEFLAEMLSKRYGETFRLDYLGLNKKGNKKYRVVANDCAARSLLREIDPLFPQSMERKAYWRRSEARFYHDEPKKAYSTLKNRLGLTDNEKSIFAFIRSRGSVSPEELRQYLNTVIGYSPSYSARIVGRMVTKQQITNVGTHSNAKYSLTVLSQ